MFKVGRVAACVCAAVLTVSGASFAKDRASNEIPPVDFSGKRWATTDGCVYSRAGRPGEAVWYLIINRSTRRDCRRMIVMNAKNDGSYQGYRG